MDAWHQREVAIVSNRQDAQDQALSQLHRIADEKGFITVDDIVNSSETHSLSITDVDRISQTLAFSDVPVHNTASIPIASRKDPLVVYEDAGFSVKAGSYSYIFGSKDNGFYAIVDGARGYSKKLGKLLRAIINALLSQHEKEILALRDSRALQGSSFLSIRYQDWPLGGIKVADGLYVRVVYQLTEANDILRRIYKYCQNDIITDSHIVLPPQSKEAEEEDKPVQSKPRSYTKPPQPKRRYSHYTNPPTPWNKSSVVSTNNYGRKTPDKDFFSQKDFSILLKTRGNITLARYLSVDADDYQGYSLADLGPSVRADKVIRKLLPHKYPILLSDILRLTIGKIGYANGVGVTTWNSLIQAIKRIISSPPESKKEVPSQSFEEKAETFAEKKTVVTNEGKLNLYTTSDPEIAEIGAALEKLTERKRKVVFDILKKLIDLTE